MMFFGLIALKTILTYLQIKDYFMSKKELTTASVFAFERKLSSSDAILYSGKWEDIKNNDNWAPISVIEKSIRGTISNRLKIKNEKDVAKFDASIENANLQTIDYASLPSHSDTLKLVFSLKILNSVTTPSVCNDPTYQAAFTEKIENHIKEYGFKEISLRYAENIANARYLWRNRLSAEKIEVHVKEMKFDKETNRSWIFNSLDLNLRKFSQNPCEQLKELANIIEKGFKGEEFVSLKIEAFALIGEGQEIFPSQELMLDSKATKSRFLYSVSGIAAMHSQKIGNALRTIDTWYPNAEEPIAVEPYGSVTSKGVAFRKPMDKTDFYTLFDNWILKNNEPQIEQKNYILAMLIRGGVFGAAKDKD